MAAAAGMLALRPSSFRAQSSGPTLLPRLASSTPDIPLPPPITRAERLQRIAKAQELMRAARLKGLLVEPGSSLVYFTGVQWSRSERLTAAVIPAEGEPLIVTPEFEEPSIRESLEVPAEVRVWNEHREPVRADCRLARRRAAPAAVRSASKRPRASSRSTACER